MNILNLEVLNQLGHLGATVLLLGGLIFLWKEYKRVIVKYEDFIERCITALTRVNDHLDEK